MRMLDVEQRSPEWHEARRGIPTASEFAEFVTPARGDLSAAADSYIDRLISETLRPGLSSDNFTGNRHTERGNALEPQARAAYAFLSGHRVRECGLILRDDGRAGCSPDGLVIEGALMDYARGVEIKCPDGPAHVGYLRGGVLPAKYRPQVHGSLVITGFPRWDFFSFCPGLPPFLVTVERDAFTDKVAATLETFLDKLAAAKKQMGLE